ncbi:MAG: thiamine phosphate synthase [Pedobacter sp.]|uniref:thiamine phosphate synthase n=1 Tax=Pedobacter sp. TaxID=1411316 RepID=UPI0033977C4A
MELIVVTQPDYFECEAELINQFFAEGLRLLHIRKPDNDAVKFRSLMKGIDPEYYPLISIHQHHELAVEFGIRRLHFKEQQRRALSDDGFCLSSSVHDPAELSKLNGFSYVFFGPVFNSISKTGYNTVLPDDFVLPDHLLKVFAIGGVEAGKLQQLQQMNFDGAAVLGSIWLSDSPLKELRNLIKSTNDHR